MKYNNVTRTNECICSIIYLDELSASAYVVWTDAFVYVSFNHRVGNIYLFKTIVSNISDKHKLVI